MKEEEKFLEQFCPHDREILRGHIEYLRRKTSCSKEVHGIKYLAGYYICPNCGKSTREVV